MSTKYIRLEYGMSFSSEIGIVFRYKDPVVLVRDHSTTRPHFRKSPEIEIWSMIFS